MARLASSRPVSWLMNVKRTDPSMHQILDTYAPTISMTLLLLMLGIFAKDDMHVSTGDVPGAFLNADLDNADEQNDMSHAMILD